MTHALSQRTTLQRVTVFFAALVLCLTAQLTTSQTASAQDADYSKAAVSSTSKSALDRQFGIGFSVGTVIGPAFQIRLSENGAIDLVAGGSWNRGRHFHFHAQYIHKFTLGDWDVGALALHVGGGIEYSHYRWGRNMIANCPKDEFGNRYCGGYYGGIFANRYKPAAKYRHWLGIRVPVGVSFAFKKAPFDVYTEFGPGMYFIHKPDFSWTYTLGGRYWF